MCTVSFVATENAFILTSNRDEQTGRAAQEPQKYRLNHKSIYFPRDPQSGGTWFAADENGTVLILLNGAEDKHDHDPPYQRSRGLVVLEIISDIDPILFWKEITLLNVEPFTIILFQSNHLYQLRWDGTEKYQNNLNSTQKYMWSSSTLYSKQIQAERLTWFDDFISSKSELKDIDLLDFHCNSHQQNVLNGLVMARGDGLKTLSITQVVLHKNDMEMVHKDLLNNKSHHNNIAISR